MSRFEPPKHIDKLTLLKSIHIFKKHRVQYEMRTHYRCLEVSVSNIIFRCFWTDESPLIRSARVSTLL